MNVDVRELNGVAVLEVSGEMIGFDRTFEQAVGTLFSSGQRNLVVVAQGITLMDNFGLGCLVRAFVQARNMGGRLVLAAPSKGVRGVFTLSRLDQTLEIFEDVNTALASFGANAS